MAFLYFDIETWSPSKELKPSECKIITIQYKDIDDDLIILKEWESDEKTILKQFYEYFSNLLESERSVFLVGFNLLRFDIPVLIYRLVKNEIDTYENVLDKFQKPFTTDLRQALLPFNDMRHKGLNAEAISEKLGLESPPHKNFEIPKMYENKEYDKIVEHIEGDMSFLNNLSYVIRRDQQKLQKLSESAQIH